MDVCLLDLPWLPEPPPDFRQQLRSLHEQTRDCSSLVRRLAAHRLTGSQLYTFGKIAMKIAEEDGDATRLGVLANGTADLIYPALAVSALRHGVCVRVVNTPFNQVALQALDPVSEINRARCHFVLLCIDHHGLPLTATPGDTERARASLDSALEYFDSICRRLHSASDCILVVQTVPQIASVLFGSLDRTVPGTMAWLIDQYNREIRLRIERSSDLLLDVAALAEIVGIARWHDARQWTLGKFSFAQVIVPLYAEWVGRLLAAARGKTRKCLVLDLDNTIWGGVIGDDGLAGIVLGNGSPTGEAYLMVQQTALALRARGIVLAVSSKNDDQVARSPFRSHPEMLLKEEHIAVFQANWEDKATNLKAIARVLNVGVDALVLLDDNPSERALVRELLPTVAVPELPDDPALYAETLLAAGYFEAIRFTREDRNRANQYQENAARTALLDGSISLDAYLRSLQMRAIFAPFDEISRARIAQLVNKTNQFNLTTHRYTESEIRRFEESSDAFTLQVRLLDRFGDNGMIAVVICAADGSSWIIDTWLMSCRVLNRGVERAILNHIVEHARTAGVHSLLGRYIRTERNDMVSEHYARLGFSPLHVSAIESSWRLDVATYTPFEVPIDVVAAPGSIGQEAAVA